MVKGKRYKWVKRGKNVTFRVKRFTFDEQYKERKWKEWISLEVYKTPENKFTSNIKPEDVVGRFSFDPAEFQNLMETIETFLDNNLNARTVHNVFNHIRQIEI
jgi:hypothetical protein